MASISNKRLWAEHPLIVSIGAFSAAASLVGLGFAFGSTQQGSATPEEPDEEVSAPAAPSEEDSTEDSVGEEQADFEEPVEEDVIDIEPTRVGKNIRFQQPFGIDLDSQETDWGIGDRSGDTIDMKTPLGFVTSDLETVDAVVAVSGDPRRATCDDPTLERWDKEIPTNDAQAGNSYCIKTDRGGWAWIDVIEFANETEDGQRFVTVIDITYWDE